MPVISHDAPAFASGSSSGSLPSAANDGNATSMWVSNSAPAWIAYDLSSVPVSQRQQVLVTWFAPRAPGYHNAVLTPEFQIPIDYTIEIHASAATTPPTSEWTQVASVTGNSNNSRQHLVNLAGASWVRMRVTSSSNPASVAIDFDVHSAPAGASDSWLFMGDSITDWSSYLSSDLPARVNTLTPSRWPAVVGAAVGVSTTSSALNVINDTLAGYPGRFVALCYGTNDRNDSNFSNNLEALVLKVIAA